MFHGTLGVEKQILTSFAISQQIPKFALRLSFGTLEYEFYNPMKNKFRTKRTTLIECIVGDRGPKTYLKLSRSRTLT